MSPANLSDKLPCGRTRPASSPVTSSREDYQETLDNHLTKNRLKKSSSRDQILDVIYENDLHFTTSELLEVVRQTHPSIGAATIYRSVALLTEAGVLRESLADQSRQAVYELATTDHHDHIICMDCDAIFEFYDEKIESIQDRVLAQMDFVDVQHKHVIFAKCTRLREQNKS